MHVPNDADVVRGEPLLSTHVTSVIDGGIVYGAPVVGQSVFGRLM